MKCFAILSALVAVSQAQYQAHPYAYGLASHHGAAFAAPIHHAAYATPYNHGAYAAPIHHGAYASPINHAVHAAPIATVRHAAPVAVAHAAPIAVAHAAPVAVAHAVALPEPAAGVHATQYHAQDEEGGYEFGYSNPNSARQEKGQAGHGVTGSYSYIDGNGLRQQVNYVADAYGFRTTGTNFPNTHATSAVHGPAVISHGLHKRELAYAHSAGPYASFAAPLGYAAPVAYAHPVAYQQAYAHPAATIVHSEPAVREATLLRIQNNPGYATSYRVY